MSIKSYDTGERCKYCGRPVKHYNQKTDDSEEIWDSCDNWIELGPDPETAQVEKCRGNRG